MILENHLHLVAEAPELSRVIQSFKRHTARTLLEHAETSGREWLLNRLQMYRKPYKVDSQYQVWQEGSHPQLIEGEAMWNQKVEYIHHNPVARGFVDVPEHWRYSSARNYLLNDHSVMAIDDVNERPAI